MDQKKLDEVKDELKTRLDALENIDAESLSDEELEDVAGGWCSISKCSNKAEDPAPVDEAV